MSKIYAIIVTYNGLKWCDRCFGSLRTQTVGVTSVVIDNGSSDGTVDYLKDYFPEVHLIEANENLGFAKANNVGLKYALEQNADYVLLLNQDACFLTDNGLERMIAQSEKNPEYWILSPMQVYLSSGRIERETERHLERSCTVEYDFISDALHGKIKDLYPSEYSCAFCWLLPRKTIETIGGFDPLFYHYGEDDNYQQRVRYHGGKVGVCPKIEVAHDIENRSSDYRNNNLDWRKYLLIQYCDINFNIEFKTLLKSKRRTIFLQCIRLNCKLLKSSIPEFQYLNEMRRRIEHSREVNKLKGDNWL